MALITGFELARPTGTCAASGDEIAVGDLFVATLVERPGEDKLERLDFSVAAWDSGARPETPLSLFGSWHTEMPEPNAQKQPFIDADGMSDLFEQLGESDDPRRQAFRYLLTLIMARKRLLKIEGQRDGAMLVRLKGQALPPERGGDGPPFIEVTNPGLDDETVASATEQLGQVLLMDEN